MILALAGRRVDATDAIRARFPLRNVGKVSIAVGGFLQQQDVTTLVSSAACGADLIGLSEAGKLGLRRRVVLPFEREKFRRESVVDRPGEWGPLYDMVLDEVGAMGDLMIMGDLAGADPYLAASRLILDEAVALGKEQREAAASVMVWDGETRRELDYTAEFGAEARGRGLAVFQISTV